MTEHILTQLLPLVIIAAVIGAGIYFYKRQELGTQPGTIIVRCSQGHVFTTIWIPFVSFKAVRLGPVRFQFCPVEDHWTFVVPVDKSSLTDAERMSASQYHDSLVP